VLIGINAAGTDRTPEDDPEDATTASMRSHPHSFEDEDTGC